MPIPILFERNENTGYWQNINNDGSRGSDTNRRTEPGHSSNLNRDYTTNNNNYMDWKGGGRKSRRNARARRNSKKSKRVRHTRRKQTRRHRHSRRR